jgi:hypothetical protein
LSNYLKIVIPFSQCLSLVSYGSVGGASSVIDRQINFDRKLLRRIEQITEMASSNSIQKRVNAFLLWPNLKLRFKSFHKAKGGVNSETNY